MSGARHERMIRALGAAVALLLLCPPPVLANAVGAVNRARNAYCGFSRASYPPLTESRGLDQVARLLADGESLEQAELHAGYRAARSLWIEISGATDEAAVERMVSGRFCGELADPRLRNIGVYGRDDGLWLVVAQPFTAPPANDAAAVSRLVLALTNEARAHGGACGRQRFPPAPPLSLAPALARAARAHSRDMAVHDFFSHTGSDGSSPGERVTRAGYRWSMVGENVASGVGTPQEVVAGWLASPHHCANIMTAGYRQMGVAFAVNRRSDKVIYWTEDFGRPLNRPRAPRRAGGRAR
ncbi:MAG: CAP domain-containing protein [Steroidobacteraceae bacterium]